jgi:hypothetical protein
VDGERFPFLTATVFEIDDVEGIQFGDLPRKSIHVVLADQAVPLEIASKWHKLAKSARERNLRAVELIIDPASRQIRQALIYHKQTPEGPALLTVNLSGKSEIFTLGVFENVGGSLHARVSMPKPEKWTHIGEESSPREFQFEAEITSPVIRQPAVTAILTGVKALTSPIAQSLLKFEAAGHKGDFVTYTSMTTPGFRAEFNEMLAKMGKAQILKMMQKMTPDTVTRKKQMTKVVVRGDRATVIVKEQGGTAWHVLVRQNGIWKIDE